MPDLPPPPEPEPFDDVLACPELSDGATAAWTFEVDPAVVSRVDTFAILRNGVVAVGHESEIVLLLDGVDRAHVTFPGRVEAMARDDVNGDLVVAGSDGSELVVAAYRGDYVMYEWRDVMFGGAMKVLPGALIAADGLAWMMAVDGHDTPLASLFLADRNLEVAWSRAYHPHEWWGGARLDPDLDAFVFGANFRDSYMFEVFEFGQDITDFAPIPGVDWDALTLPPTVVLGDTVYGLVPATLDAGPQLYAMQPGTAQFAFQTPSTATAISAVPCGGAYTAELAEVDGAPTIRVDEVDAIGTAVASIDLAAELPAAPPPLRVRRLEINRAGQVAVAIELSTGSDPQAVVVALY